MKEQFAPTKEVYLTALEKGDAGWPPEDARECVAWFVARLAEIPPEHLATAKIDISAYEDSARLYIYYLRPENEAELKKRKAWERAAKKLEKARELKLLAELQAKHKR